MKKKDSNLTSILPVPLETIERRIYLVRGVKVMIDSDLAELYQVETFNLNKAVKRNTERFPGDFMFQLTKKESENLIFQIGISSSGYGGRRFLPYVFTEQGVAMLSSVLNSKRAVQMNILIMRAFVKLREVLASNKALAERIESLSKTTKDHDILFDIILKDINNLDNRFTKEIRRLKNPRRQKIQIGFRT
jgi:hypothetical protein